MNSRPIVSRPGRTLAVWSPEDKAFWEREGEAIARLNLWISVPALFLAFAIWQVWSVVAVNLPTLGFGVEIFRELSCFVVGVCAPAKYIEARSTRHYAVVEQREGRPFGWRPGQSKWRDGGDQAVVCDGRRRRFDSRLIRGGLVNVNSGTITQSYATGPVTYNPNYCGHFGGNACLEGPGALVGWNLGTGKITQSFATGTIIQDLAPTGGQLPAGIANNNEGLIGRDVYWDTQTTGATVGAAQGNAVPVSQGLTSPQMGSTASFGPTWDFGANGVWAMPTGATHPVLRWQLAQ